jgi:predicted GNAT superfamily acetyltransferase
MVWVGRPAVPTVRSITDPETLGRFEELQMQIWGMSDREVVPLHQLVAAVSAGGTVLGAFAPDRTLVGFAYAFPAIYEGEPAWHSHMTGVLPEHQGTGLGFKLKCAQREAALAAGIDRIVWTYDPLQAGNARFNLGRLGALARRYHVDYYGVMKDAINKGLPSDRFEVDWLLRSPRVTARLAGAPRPPLDPGLPWALESDGNASSALPGAPRLDLRGAQILVEIPPNLARLKAEDPGTARRWREATRMVFRRYFAQGYCAVDAAVIPHPSDPRMGYVLERADRLEKGDPGEDRTG